MRTKTPLGETVRGFEVYVENRRKPGTSVRYPPLTIEEATKLMKVMTQRGLICVARTDGKYSGEEWLTLEDLEELQQ